MCHPSIGFPIPKYSEKCSLIVNLIPVNREPPKSWNFFLANGVGASSGGYSPLPAHRPRCGTRPKTPWGV